MRSRATAGATRAGWCDYLPSLATLWVRRDTLRSAALRWITPFWAARMISGAADFKAAVAAALSPEAIASSTLRTEVRISERRDLLTSVRRAITRAALRAGEVLAIDGSPVGGAGQFGQPPVSGCQNTGGGLSPPVGQAYSRPCPGRQRLRNRPFPEASSHPFGPRRIVPGIGASLIGC